MIKYWTVVFLLSFFSLHLSSQTPEFGNPVGFDIYLSGTFAELRSNHFHSGIDIRTQQTTGHPVYAIADGWVSRVKVRAYGFGHAIYLTHPSGYTSVYAHLEKFEEPIASVVRKRQYAKQSFNVDQYLSRNQYKVNKGDVIGYTGNTGSSGGPHLHFEIRDALSQKPTNVLQYNYRLRDEIFPLIQRIRLYPVGPDAFVDGKRNGKSFSLYQRGQGNTIDMNSTEVSGKLAFGVQTIDQLNGSVKRNGPYRVSMYADGDLFWEFKADRFSFAESRYMNAMIDYASYKSKKQRYYQSYQRPGNKLSMLAVKNRGLIELQSGETKTIRIEVADIAGNISDVSFKLKGVEAVRAQHKLKGVLMHHDQQNVFRNQDASITIPAGALYDTLDFRYTVESMPDDGYSQIHHFHNERTPLHKNAAIAVKVERLVHNGIKNKLLLARKDKDGDLHDHGGYWKNGMIVTTSRALGSYVVMADTVRPKVRPLNIANGAVLNAQDEIRFRITDDLSGVQYYRGEIDGKWVLFEYYPNQKLLRHQMQGDLQAGKHKLRLVVSDEKQNTTVYTTTFSIQ